MQYQVTVELDLSKQKDLTSNYSITYKGVKQEIMTTAFVFIIKSLEELSSAINEDEAKSITIKSITPYNERSLY